MKRTFTGICAALLAAATLTLVGASPAAAGGCGGDSGNAPDGRMRFPGGEWEGGAQYANTSLNAALGIGQQASYEMQWRNRGGDNLTIRVKLGYFDREGYGVKFFSNGENVSAHLRQGKSLAFPHVPPGKRTGIVTVQIRNKSATSFSAFVELFGFYAGASNPGAICDALFAEAND